MAAMSDRGGLLDSLRAAVAAAPGDIELRLHLARLLIDDGLVDEAVSHLGQVLALQPDAGRARQLLGEAFSQSTVADAAAMSASRSDGFDWTQAEAEVDDIVGPGFVDSADPDAGAAPAEDSPPVEQRPTVRLLDVGGLEAVKRRLETAFLVPMRNPELTKLYGKSLRGGLLLYGPPGCGKTFIARALAGELGASFYSVSIADVLSGLFGESEGNVHRIFEFLRAHTPCVLFVDELDSLGGKRTNLTNDSMRGVVNQFLIELDGANGDNEGVFVLGATNQPWDVDGALRRPGRFDRTVFVPPPDAVARAAIFRSNLEHRPVERIDVEELARASAGLSGADIAYVCEVAAERALIASAESGVNRLIGMPDLNAALREVRPSTGTWLDAARTFVEFGRVDPAFEELRLFLKSAKRS